MKATALRAAAPALLLATLVLVPFQRNAFTIDDTVFLRQAEHVLEDPLHPTAFSMAWRTQPERVSQILPTGPVIAWLLVPAVAAGGSEAVAHGVELALFLAALLATVSLGQRLGLSQAWAGAAGLIVASTPAALGMAGTAMPDIPGLAFGVAGIERLVAWREDRRGRTGVVAALLLGLAALTRTQLLLLVGVGALLLVDDPFSLEAWRRVAWTHWLPLLAAPAVTGVLTLVTADPAARAGSIGGAAARYSGLEFVAPNIVAFATHWTLAMVFALPWAVLRWRPLVKRAWVFIGASAATALVLRMPDLPYTPWFLPLAAGLGTAVLVDVMVDALQRRDAVQLALGLWLLLPLVAVVYLHFPSKYLVPSAPAAAILLAREMSGRRRIARPLLAASVAAGVTLGVAILRADAALADFGREIARTVVEPRVEAGEHVWFVGHWGFQWYAERAGARFLSVSPPYPMRGDTIVVSAVCDPHLNAESLRDNVIRVGRVESRAPGGRLMDRAIGAGFFSNGWGYLPWAWGDGVLDAVDILQFVKGPSRTAATGRQSGGDATPR